MLKLYGTPPTRALRAIWLLNELNLEYETIPVDILGGEHQRPAFLEINPAGKVPVLVDGSTVVTESVAIQLYLADKHPEAGFIPETVEDRAEMHRWLLFVVTEIEQPLWRIARNKFIYPEEKRSPQDIEIARQECRGMLAVLEAHMKHRDFMAGRRLGVADFNAAYILDWANEENLLEDAPKLKDYLAKMYARPAAPPRIAAALAAAQS